MTFFGIKQRENETNDGTELALREFMRTNLKILPVDKENIYFDTESTELLQAVHNQMAEVFDHFNDFNSLDTFIRKSSSLVIFKRNLLSSF